MACRSSMCETILPQAMLRDYPSITTSVKGISQSGLRPDGPWRGLPHLQAVSQFDSRNQMIAISLAILAFLSIHQALLLTEALCTPTGIPDQGSPTSIQTISCPIR